MRRKYNAVDVFITATLCVVLTIFVCVIVISNKEKSAVSAHTETEPRLIHDSKYDVYVFTDKETGIEYLIVDSDRSGSISITPRIKYSNKYNGYDYNEDYIIQE